MCIRDRGYGDAAQHSQCLYAIFAHMPGIKVVVPSNAYDAKGLMVQAIRDNNPVIFMYHKGIMGLPWMAFFEGSSNAVPEDLYVVPFGKANIVKEGSDLTIVTISQMVQKAILASIAFCTIWLMVTMVKSEPSFTMLALPNGTTYKSSGTALLLPSKKAIHGSPMMPLWYMKITGLLSRIA